MQETDNHFNKAHQYASDTKISPIKKQILIEKEEDLQIKTCNEFYIIENLKSKIEKKIEEKSIRANEILN